MKARYLCAGLLWAATAVGAPPAELRVELNKLEPVEGGCRVYLLFENGLEERLQSLKLDLVMFDDQSVIARRVAVEGGPLAAGKTVLKVFDLPELPCADLGRMLLNGVTACEGEAGPHAGCEEAVRTASRAEIDFIK